MAMFNSYVKLPEGILFLPFIVCEEASWTDVRINFADQISILRPLWWNDRWAQVESQVAGRTFRLEFGMCVGGLQSVIQKHFEQHQNKHRVPLIILVQRDNGKHWAPKRFYMLGLWPFVTPSCDTTWPLGHLSTRSFFRNPWSPPPGSAWEEARCYGACQGDEVSCLQHLVVGRCLERGTNTFGSVFYNYTSSCLFWS